MKRVLLFFAMLYAFIGQCQVSTVGTEFWLGYMQNLDIGSNATPSFYFYVRSESSGIGVIRMPAIDAEIPFTYEADENTRVDFPPGIYYHEGSEEVRNFGIQIITSTPSSVFAFHERLFFTEASKVFPIQVLGDRYRILAAEDYDEVAGSPSSFVVIATEDNTEVVISPTQFTLEFTGGPGSSFTIQLNKGQSYQVQAIGDLSGSLVKAKDGKKIAVFSGAKYSHINCTSADSHIWGQLLPNQLLGKEFALIPFKGGGSNYKVVAREDDTEIYVNDNFINTLNAGEFIFEGFVDPSYLKSSKPIQVGMIHNGAQCSNIELGDPNLVIIPPIEYTSNILFAEHIRNLSTSAQNSPNPFFYLNLIATTDGSEAIYMNGVDITNDFKNFPNQTDLYYYDKKVDEGSYTIESSANITGYAYGMTRYDMYTYHLDFANPDLTNNILDIQKDIEIYPNPASNKLFIGGELANMKISVFDMLGKPVLEYEKDIELPNEIRSLDISQLLPGAYVLKIWSDNGQDSHVQLFIKR